MSFIGFSWPIRDAAATYRAIAKRATMVFADDDEARLLAPGAATSGELAHTIADLGPSQVLIKLDDRARSPSGLLHG